MSKEFGFIGWCNEDNHDKVWGYFYRPSPAYDTEVAQRGWSVIPRNVCIFWGRRGKAIQFKATIGDYELATLVDSKIKKGYNRITETRLYEIWPSFEMEKDLKLTVEVLAGRVK